MKGEKIMEDIKVNPGFVCEVGDIFEYPKTGECEKLRGERIVVLEKGKGCNPDHTYIRVLSFKPEAENDSFHFSCNDRYLDKVLEHWRYIGHMDISAVTNPEKFMDTWSNQAEYDARNNVKTADDVRYLVKRSMHNATSFNGMWTLHYIARLLDLVYKSGMKYDVEHLFLDIVDYARSACYLEDLTRALKIISQTPFTSKYISGGERFGQPSFLSIDKAAKLINEAKAHIAMGGSFTVKDLRDLTEVRTGAFAEPAEYIYGWNQCSLFDDTLIYEDPDESGVYRICIPAPRRLRTTVTKDDLAQAKGVSEAFEKCVTAIKDEELEGVYHGDEAAAVQMRKDEEIAHLMRRIKSLEETVTNLNGRLIEMTDNAVCLMEKIRKAKEALDGHE